MTISFQNQVIEANKNVPPLIFTDSAAAKVYALIQDEGNQNLKLRISISGGGCSGFQYGFSFVVEINKDEDFVISKIVNGTEVQLLVSYLCLQYLQGAEIDYVKDVAGEHFVIRNPNAKTTCGCGSSFNV